MQEKGLERLVYTVDELAEILGISRPTAYQGIRTGKIPYIRVGARILIPKSALDKLLSNAGPKPKG